MATGGELRQVTIASPEGGLRATFVPAAGMVCCSLRHRDHELLATRSGVRAYAERNKTMGIPLLHPWANRLAHDGYEAAGRRVALAPDSPLLARDPNGLPIHGVVPGWLPWELASEPQDGQSAVAASLRWERPELLALFPFPHRLDYEARLQGGALTIALTLRPIASAPVPVSFGFHPYLSLPGAARASWRVRLPVCERLMLDERSIPTGTAEPLELAPFQLGDSAWDDALAALPGQASFTATAAGRTVAVELVEGYSHAQVYSPADADFICFEPMTAPANALNSGAGLRLVEPDESFRAVFRVVVG